MLVSELLATYKGRFYWVYKFNSETVILWQIWNGYKFEVSLKDIEKIQKG